jgi:hypothetical protein
MSYNYTEYVAQLANLMVVNSNDAEFTIFLPGCIDYAEQRIYRELDLLNTLITSSGTCSSNNRELALPTGSGTYITVENVNIITPAGQSASAGTRNPLFPASLAVLDLLWPSSTTGAGVPQMFAMKDSTTIILGPAPDAAYTAEIRGIQRPASLSSTNTTTLLTSYVPDLFMAASMVYASGYMRNFGSQADDPKMSQSWESQYQTLFKSAQVEQFRAKFQSQSWSSQAPTPANPPRS